MASESLPTIPKREVPRTRPSRVVFNRNVGPGWYLLRLEEPSIAATSRPGQFVQVLCTEPNSISNDPLLRRPFSVYDVDIDAGTYDILYVVTGRGTRWMAALPEAPGDRELFVDVIGPFGNRFTPPAPDDVVVLAGGGVGVAPLYFLARELTASGATDRRAEDIVLCMGARSEGLLQGIEDFRRLPIRSEVATNDGSAGFHGFVTGLVEELLDGDLAAASDRVRIYGCGPTGMNEALRSLAVERALRCEICLEAYMACGFGICFACVVPIAKERDGSIYNRRICLEGPVFDAELIEPGLGVV